MAALAMAVSSASSLEGLASVHVAALGILRAPCRAARLDDSPKEPDESAVPERPLCDDEALLGLTQVADWDAQLVQTDSRDFEAAEHHLQRQA